MDARGGSQGQLLFYTSAPFSYVVGSSCTSRCAELNVSGVAADAAVETASNIPFFPPSILPRMTAEEKLPALTFGTAAKFGNENFAATTAALPSFILPELE